MRESVEKRVLSYFQVLLAAAWVVSLVIVLIKTQTERFHDSLYVYTNLLITQQIFLDTVRRIILTVSLLAFGMACIFLYIISYETEEFLLYTRVFWYAAGLITSLWDYTAVFHVVREYGRFLRCSGDLCLVLFLSSAYSAILQQMDLAAGKVFKRVNAWMSGISLVIFGMGGLHLSQYYLKCYFLGILSLSAVSLYAYLKINIHQRRMALANIADHLLVCCLFAVPVLIAFVAVHYKYHTLSKGYGIYLNVLPFVILPYTVLLFVRFFQYHRTGFLVGSNVNRKIAEITRHKEAITKLILNRCIIPINNLSFYKQMLKEEQTAAGNQKAGIIFHNMEHEIQQLKESIDNIENFHYLFGRDTHGEKIKMNLAAVLHYTFHLLESEGVGGKFRMIWNRVTDQDFVCGDPSLLIQANKTFLSALADIQIKNSETIQLDKRDDGKIAVTMLCGLEREKLPMAKKIRRILKSPVYTRPMMTDEELSLYVAKGNIRSHSPKLECRIWREGQNSKIRIQYELDSWAQKGGERADRMEPQMPQDGHTRIIILLSTAPEQIEIIRSYLVFEDYKLLSFHTEEDALKYIEKGRNIRAVIIGTIFSSVYVNKFCKNVREFYSLEQLPILVICRDKYRYVNQELLRYINDIIPEPFEQIDLQRKLQLLLMLQNSAQETARAKLDFLQAQMDPHFIFNTISTIMPLCMQAPMQAYEMLNYFSQYLRGRLYTNDLQESIPIGREVELIQAYLAIERVRFPEYLEYEIRVQVPEETAILPLLIEPIVENSVKHGIKGREKLRIVVDIADGKDHICISVTDNGRGMTKEKIQEIMEEHAQSPGLSIGIWNVRKRLSIYYNQRLTIQSVPDIGTKTSFQIPKHYLQ